MVRISLACTAAAALVVLFPALGTGADPAELGSGAQEAIREASSPGGTADGEPGGTGPVLGAVHGGHAPVIHPDAPDAAQVPTGSQADSGRAPSDLAPDSTGSAAEEAPASPAEAIAPAQTAADGQPEAEPADSQPNPAASGASDGQPEAAPADSQPNPAASGASDGQPLPRDEPPTQEAPAAAAPPRRSLAAAAPSEQSPPDAASVPAAPVAEEEEAPAAPSPQEVPIASRASEAQGGGRGPGEVREEADPPAADVNPEGGQSNRQSSDKTAPQHDVERAGGADAVFQPSNLLTLPLAAGETVSLFEDIGPDREGWVVRGGFAVATTGDATATVRVTGSWGQTVWEGRGRQSGTWAFKAQRGTLEVQITNSNPGLAVMTLGWVVGGDKDNAFAQQSDRGESASGGGATVDLESGPRISALMDSMTRATAAVHASMDAAQARMQTNAVWMRHNHQSEWIRDCQAHGAARPAPVGSARMRGAFALGGAGALAAQ